MAERTILFWDTEGRERLTHTDQDEAIECILEGHDSVTELPKTLEICGYARMELPRAESLCGGILERLLESLDEDYGDPEGSYSEGTEDMKEAAKVFAVAVLSEYTGWPCDLVKRETIDVPEWVKANRPEWLDQ